VRVRGPVEERPSRFGKFGQRFCHLAMGIENTAVKPHHSRRALTQETTFERELLLAELAEPSGTLAAKVWKQLDLRGRQPRTVVLKLKTSDFRTVTRSHTPLEPPASADVLHHLALGLLDKVGLDQDVRFRLVGVGLSNFEERNEQHAQAALF